MEIAPNIHAIEMGFVYAYLILADDSCVLIDTGLDRSAKKIIGYIKNAGFTMDQLTAIMINHADGDHYGGLHTLQTLSGAKVYASSIEADAIEQGVSSRKLTPTGFQKLIFSVISQFIKPIPASVNQNPQNAETLPILDGLEVIATPGHTPGHLAYFLPSMRILFAGDSITGSSDKLISSHGANTADEAQAKESFKKLYELKPEKVLAGHCLSLNQAYNHFFFSV